MLLPMWDALLVEHDQLIRSSDRQLSQQHLVDEREDRGVCADPERQGQNRHNREQRASAKPTHREPKVGQKVFIVMALTVGGPEQFTAFCDPRDPRSVGESSRVPLRRSARSASR